MMRCKYLTALWIVFACLTAIYAQQKEHGWIPQGADTFRIGPGAYNGIAVFNTHGWEAIHIRLDIDARLPVTIGVVPLDDWNKAVQNRDLLDKLNYACLTEGITRLNFSCDFYASYTSRVVVMRDLRHWEHREGPVVSGIGAPLARMAYEGLFANEIHVVRFHWGCTANCDLPDPPRFAWVDLRREKYEITSAMKSYGPFTPEKNDDKIRIFVKTPFPMTVAVVPSPLVDELYGHRERAPEILSKTACKQYGVQKTSFDCTLQISDGPQQVVLLPEVEIRKKKKAEITISTVKCVANCVP